MPDTTPRTEDWLDRLYADEQPPTAAPVEPVRGGGRLPDWWAPKRDDAVAPEPDEAETDQDEDTPAVELVGEPETPPTPPVIEQEGAGSGWWQAQPGYYPTVHVPTAPAPAAKIALSTKTRSALYNGAAAGAGWLLGLEPLIAHAIADCGATTSIGGALVLGGGCCLLIAHLWDRHTRHWWIGLAWVARIPLASAITALALYAPASQL